MDNSFVYSQRNLAHIGYQVMKHLPEVAADIISLSPPPIPAAVNLDLIPVYFAHYCQITGLPAETIQLKGNRSAAEHRRIFIAVILRAFHPYVYDRPEIFFKPLRGLELKLKECLHVGRHVHNEVYKVKGWIKGYEDFKRDALNIYSQIIQLEDGATEK